MKKMQHYLVIIFAFSIWIGHVTSDEAIVNPPAEMKCGECPCGNPCEASPPPPPPSPPPPPKTPSEQFCPPPPSLPLPPTLVIMGPPVDLYPVDAGYYPSDASRSWVAKFPDILMGLILAMLFGCL